MNYERWMMSCEWWVMNDELWVMSCELWVMSYEFLVRSFIASYTILWIRIGYLSETNLIFWGKLIYQSRSDVPLVAVGGNPRNMVIIYLECRRHGLSIYFTDHAYGIFKILGDCFPCITIYGYRQIMPMAFYFFPTFFPCITMHGYRQIMPMALLTIYNNIFLETNRIAMYRR